MNTTQAQQKSLDDALVAPTDRLEFGKCNMRLKTDIKPKEATFQVVLDALALTPFYRAFLITTDVPAIYIQEFWATIFVHRSSIRFTINKKKVSLDVDIFRDILQFCPKIPGQVFEDLPLDQDILFFIRDIGHTRDITNLTDVNVDYLHQPWRAFSTVNKKCLSGKETRMDKIRLSHAQILWGMFHNKNIDYVYLLWEDLLFQIEYKDAKKTSKMSYPRFTRIIIDYFMSKDPSISRRNNMFWHTARDDTLFTSMRCISRHEDTQVYDTILPTELTNQAMLESKAYQTYYAFASGEKAPKPKYIRKKVDLDTSPKKKHVQATKGTRLKSKAKVTKPDKMKQPAKKTQAKGLVVLFEVALTEAEQLKLATKRSKKDFHVSHACGLGDGVNTQSKVPDEQQQKTFGTDEGTGTILGVPDVPPYEYESDKESWGDSEDKDDTDDDGESENHDDDSDDERTESNSDEIPDPKLTNVDQTEYKEEDVDDRVRTPLDYELTDDEKLDDEETMDDEEDDEVIKELYDDVNVNFGNDDTEMTDADQGASEQQNVSQESGFEQEEEDAHVTLTTVIKAHKADEPVQSSSVSSDFTSKLLNLVNPSPANNEFTLLLETSAHHATVIPKITSGFTTTTPPPTPFFNPILQQQTPTFTTTTSTNPTVTLPEIPNFASIFKFDQRVYALESEMSEFKKTNQFAEAVSSILGIVDTYLASKMKDVVDVAVQLQTNKLREEAQAENQEFLNQVDSTMKTIIKDQVKAQVSKIMPKIEKSFTGSNRGTKRRKSSKDTESSKDSRSKEKKSSSTSKDVSQSQHKSPGKSVLAEEPKVTKADWFKKPEQPPTPDPDWSKIQQVDFRPPQIWISQAIRAKEPPTSFDEFNDTSFDFSAFVLNRLKIPNLTQEILVGPAFNLLKGTCKSIMELEYHLEECSKATIERLDWHNPENKPTSHWGPKCQSFYGYASNLTSSKDVYSRKRIIAVTRLTIMKKYDYGHLEEIEVRRDDQSNLKNKTAYTSHSDPHGIIYVDQFKRKRLMRTDELCKFSDGTLNDVRTDLHDIAGGIRMEYLPMRKWSNLENKRARVMVQDIDKQFYQRRLMRNLEMFVGGRIYGKDLRLLERTI
ncbi:hypothetical protein Tco_0628465 [Tanacetum coccineum]|uniref:Reverse transcriptase domain-containing protein n=1 Tax=Tanacetum coccineum TaxID=301880 RepID=A0ABQ4WQH9_9ASTR